VGVWGAGWSMGMVEALPGTRERAREVMLESHYSMCTPALMISRSSTSSSKSQAFFDEDDLVDVDQPESTLRTSRSRVSARQVSHSRAAWAGVRQGYCAHLICCMPIAAATEDHGMLRSLVVILRPLSPPDERKPWK